MTLAEARDRWKKAAARSARRLLAALSHTVQAARHWHRWVRGGIDLTLFGVFLTWVGVWVAVVAFAVELEDRQTERTFRAWQLVLSVPSAGSSRRETFEYLNREFDGSVCGALMEFFSEQLTGNNRRRCLFTPKERESLVGIKAVATDLSTADLTGAFLMGANLSRADLTDAFLTGGRPGSCRPDRCRPNGRRPNGRLPDGHQSDGRQPGGRQPGGRQPNGRRPGAQQPSGRRP